MNEQITYGQLGDLLLFLDFQIVPAREQWRAFRHADTGTVIVFANRKPTQRAREPDICSVRRHLADNGIVDEAQFEHVLADAA